MRVRLKISPQIEQVAPLALQRTSGETKFFDRRYED
jgi:hypothetical protein